MGAFDVKAEEYDAHYDRYPFEYESELAAVRALTPKSGRGLEVGVGTGRFASRLGVGIGLDPSEAMAAIARGRGIDVRPGKAERMPFDDASFDFVLMITVLNFVDDIPAGLAEARRVLRPGGSIVIGMIDLETDVGQAYARGMSPDGSFKGFMKLSVARTTELLGAAGFGGFEYRQTIYRLPAEMTAADEALPGHGEGLFVVIRGTLPGGARLGKEKT